ncbi:MAG TPA: uroporphyrinogen decarboxylase family protein [Methylomirabilota bacterium]|nr:uroporphyrinogen decarboxylase family protein [Methylomirabilota bacterium]
MTKRERVLAALARAPVDRPPVAFWRHAPDVDHTPKGLADAMLAFHRRFDLDLIKIMSSGVYCVEDWGCTVAYTGSPNGAKQCTEHAVKAPGDWARVRELDPGAGALGRELEALRLIVRGRHDDAPVLHTVFAPLTVARKLAGERLHDDLRARPEAVAPALDAIARTMARYAAAALEAGADGLFLATQTASADVVRDHELESFELPATRRLVESVAGRTPLLMLHVHGRAIAFDRLAALPVHAINWHDRLTPPALADARKRFGGALVGGLREAETLRRGPAAAVGEEVRDAIRQTGGRGLIVAPGCVLPLDVPEAHLDAVVAAVKGGRA